MPVFAVEVKFVDDPPLVDGARPHHRQYIDDLSQKGLVCLAGPWADGRGGLIIYDSPDRATLDDLLRDDPYAQRGAIAETRVHEWKAVLGTLSGALPAT
ncbi:MAG: YciI family protein [Actinomycetota bacterium]|jgi:uncharacterized protein